MDNLEKEPTQSPKASKTASGANNGQKAPSDNELTLPFSFTFSFEKALEQLQLAVKKLESGELTLEQSLQQFEEGVRLTQICQQHLKAADQKVEILTRLSSGGPGAGSATGGGLGAASDGPPEFQAFSVSPQRSGSS